MGEVLAGAWLEGRELYLEEAGLLGDLEKLGFGIVAFACTTCNGMSGALDPKIQQEIIDRDLYATAVLSGNRNFDGRIHPTPSRPSSPRRRWWWPTPLPAPCASTSRTTCSAVTDGKEVTPEGHLAFG